MNILVIDSGYGGLPLLEVLKNKNKDNSYIYIADTANFPYGTKSDEYLKKNIKRIEKNISNIDEVFLACNTASALFINDTNYKGVIKPVIKYIRNSKHKNIMIFATKSTLRSNIYQKNIYKNFIVREQTELISKIEKNEDYLPILLREIQNIDKRVDCLVLGCTHFLLIKDDFKRYLNIDIVCVDELI